jgi:dCTP diphosphatase
MNDETASLCDLRQIVAQFVGEREWQQFHAPKNISMALTVEAAELMEHFQWIDAAASRRGALSDEQVAAIGEEVADVFCYIMALANELDIDLTKTFLAKMDKNRHKYPAEAFRGKF